MFATSPPKGLPFLKMHGLGNDFVILDSRGGAAVTTPALAQQIGDRHFGVGFDQLAEIRDGTDEGADILLDFWNTDGTRAGACGNATRCVADIVMSEGVLDRLRIRTARGVLIAERSADGRVSVNMGQPQTLEKDIPLAQGTDPLALPLEGAPIAVGMGNPHCVFFVPDADLVDPAVRGPAIETDPLFPERTNVEFVSRRPDGSLRLRVWERGAGVTLACGSGACAVAVAAQTRGIISGPVRVHLDGGILDIDPREDGVWMTGPVARVFSGWLDPAMLDAAS
ncbi:MAG: diaminopimelate epimerase [Rhodobacteraceae bacterium]|nr:diaminopimelate epimerase [Paracoccaceae bacterium]